MNDPSKQDDMRPEGRVESETSEPYERAFRAGFTERPYMPFRPDLRGKVVAVLTTKSDDRGLKLIYPRTRCIKRYDIHELIVTDEPEPSPGGTVNRIAYVANVEFYNGGVIVEGDAVRIGGYLLGTIAGFDETHLPNHMNIVLKGPKRITGLELRLKGREKVLIKDED